MSSRCAIPSIRSRQRSAYAGASDGVLQACERIIRGAAEAVRPEANELLRVSMRGVVSALQTGEVLVTEEEFHIVVELLTIGVPTVEDALGPLQVEELRAVDAEVAIVDSTHVVISRTPRNDPGRAAHARIRVLGLLGGVCDQ